MRELKEFDIEGHTVFYIHHEYEWYMTFEEFEYPNWPESFEARKKLMDSGRRPRISTGFTGFLYRQEQMLIDWNVWEGDPTKWNDEYRMRAAFERYLCATQQAGVYSKIHMDMLNRSIAVMTQRHWASNAEDVYKRQNNSKWFSQEGQIEHNHVVYHRTYNDGKLIWRKAGAA